MIDLVKIASRMNQISSLLKGELAEMTKERLEAEYNQLIRILCKGSDY